MATAAPTRDSVYRGTPQEQQAAYSKDAAVAAQNGWVPIRRAVAGDSLRVTYEHVEPVKRGWVDSFTPSPVTSHGPVSNWPGMGPRPTPPPAGANPVAFALSQGIARYVSQGYRVQSQDAWSAVMVKGHRVNHILHAILTIFLLGLWLFVWIPLALFGGESRVLLTVDDAGRVSELPA